MIAFKWQKLIISMFKKCNFLYFPIFSKFMTMKLKKPIWKSPIILITSPLELIQNTLDWFRLKYFLFLSLFCAEKVILRNLWLLVFRQSLLGVFAFQLIWPLFHTFFSDEICTDFLALFQGFFPIFLNKKWLLYILCLVSTF